MLDRMGMQSRGQGCMLSAGQRAGDPDVCVSMNIYGPPSPLTAEYWVWACCTASIHQGTMPTC